MSSALQAGDACPKCAKGRGRITTSRPIRGPDVDTFDGPLRGALFATDYSCDQGHSWREVFPPLVPPEDKRVGHDV
jgi:hypothetical protein